MKKAFFFKIIGLYGIIMSITEFIREILSVFNNLRLSNQTFSVETIVNIIQNSFGDYSGLYLLFIILMIIGSFIIFFIGISSESYINQIPNKGISLENQVVGIILLVSALMRVSTLIRVISLYLRYKNFDAYDYPEELVSIYYRQIFINLFPIVIYGVIGILLLTCSYRKRVVYNLTTNE